MRGARRVVTLRVGDVPSLVAIALLAACGGKKTPASAAPRIANALAAALTAAEHTKAPWRCIAADLPEPAATLPKPWKLVGSSLQHDNDKDHDLVIGVVADAGGDDPKTLAALGRLRARLDEAHADLVLALGG